MVLSDKTAEQLVIEKHTEALRRGFHVWPELQYGKMPALGDYRWTADLILSTWVQAETGKPPTNELEYRVGNSGGGFDLLEFKFLPEERWFPKELPRWEADRFAVSPTTRVRCRADEALDGASYRPER